MLTTRRGECMHDVDAAVWTSAWVVMAMDMEFNVQINPRFPLFGGWKTVWYQGYNIDATRYLAQSSSGDYVLSYPALIPFADLPMRKYTLRVVMPEGATISSVNAPFPFELSYSRRFTYLDGPNTGRQIANLEVKGPLVSSGTYSGDVVVRFTISPFAVYWKIGYLFVAFLLAFVVLIGASRVDLSLSKATKKVHTE